MTTATRVRFLVGFLLGALTLFLCVIGVGAVWGLTVEYGAGLQVLAIAVLVPSLLAAITAQVWPGLGNRTRLLVPVVLGLLLVGAGLVGHQLGLREREQRAVEASARIGCNGPNSEVTVDARVDEVFADLPRPTNLYGPIEGTRHGCGAGVDGGDEGFDAWAEVLRDLDGFEVVRDEPEVVAVRRADGITIVLRAGDVPVLTVSTREGADLSTDVPQDGSVVGSSVASAWSPASRNPTDR